MNINTELEVTLQKEPFPLLLVKGMFTEAEQKDLFNEIRFLSKGDKLYSDPFASYSAVSDNGTPLKKNSGIFIDEVYKDKRAYSDILSITNTLFDEGLLGSQDHWWFKSIVPSPPNVLLSYYANGDYYKPHKDSSLITALTWFWEEPKEFEGGDLIFPEYGIKVPIELNTTVFFPSCILHEVTEIKVQPSSEGIKNGRFVLAFLGST